MRMFDKWDWIEALMNDNKSDCSGWRSVHITSGPVGTNGITPTTELVGGFTKEYDSVYTDNKKENTNMNAIPDIKKVAFDDANHKTTIVWGDGQHTTVTNTSGNPDDHYAGFCTAVCKKLFGSTTAVIKTMHTFDVDEVAQKKKAQREDLEAKSKEILAAWKETAAKEKRRAFDKMVDEEVLRERARRKAINILNKEAQRTDDRK